MYNYNSSRKQCCTHVINFSFLHVLYVFKLKKWHSCAKYKFLRMVFRVFVGRLVVFLIKKIVFLQKYKILNICMTGTNLLIVAIIIVFVISFIITVLVLYVNTKKIIATNTKLVENQNSLLEQYKILGSELERRMSELEEQKEKIEILKRQHDELAEQLKQGVADEMTLLRVQMREHRENIEKAADMTDEQLMVWIDSKMEETHLFTDSSLTLKSMANALGITQKRLAALFKNHPKYGSLGEYLNEKRFLYACHLLREEPNWTIEAVGAEAGFGGRRTFQTEVKRRLGITPLQYRQGMESVSGANN